MKVTSLINGIFGNPKRNTVFAAAIPKLIIHFGEKQAICYNADVCVLESFSGSFYEAAYLRV